ncbi:MAG: hypothetical protein AAB371_00375 [Patescibacteria group bacterium]
MIKKKKNNLKIEKALKSVKERNDRDVLILWEDANDKFQIAIEGYRGLYQRIDDLEEKMVQGFAEVHTILLQHSKILEEHSKILEEHSKILKEHSNMIGEIQKDVEILKQDTAQIRMGLQKRVDFYEFNRLERRVIALERKVRV